ncbi:MAG TPA: ribosome silencing factor [Burkholderiaceae bacterium]|nr:ribosome silencing factor [Burkholderiaceae bacterium]HMX11438.1 ribosome silencing factor [Burkholderiaceae bacterium]HMY99793.1 ribosome silencing factor [Burkholderiaceae bacterium]HNB43649.1 ribosome silencing factor [Burkholderiaceae bacterium]HNG78947.1 ribosome silencing factor [Burkholderiaceae bacterium]
MDIRKLQRAIVDGLEDVKAQDITVFNTEHLSPLFERVVVASGTSNRQTKALASSVREAVKSAGGQVLSVEGEDNGEWIIVDCGAAVAHIMQPAIRQYYHLEEIWGGKAVRMKMGSSAPKGLPKASTAVVDDEDEGSSEALTPAPKPRARRSGSAAEAKEPARKATKRAAPADAVGAKPMVKPVAKPAAKKVARKTAAGKTTARKSPRSGEVAPVQKIIVQPTRPAAQKAPARKTAAGKTAAGKAAAGKTVAVKRAAPAKRKPVNPAQ